MDCPGSEGARHVQNRRFGVVIAVADIAPQARVLVEALGALFGSAQVLTDPGPQFGSAAWCAQAEMDKILAACQGLDLDFAEGAASPAAWRTCDHDRRKVRGNLGGPIALAIANPGLKAAKMRILHGLAGDCT